MSLDDPDKNQAFADSQAAKHVVLSDPGGRVARAYGVTGAGGLFARRWTFYIDSNGTVRDVDKQIQTETAGRDIARRLGELGFPAR